MVAVVVRNEYHCLGRNLIIIGSHSETQSEAFEGAGWRINFVFPMSASISSTLILHLFNFDSNPLITILAVVLRGKEQVFLLVVGRFSLSLWTSLANPWIFISYDCISIYTGTRFTARRFLSGELTGPFLLWKKGQWPFLKHKNGDTRKAGVTSREIRLILRVGSR